MAVPGAEAPILVMLVAGIGQRLRPFTDNNPKALIEFDGVSIAELCLDNFAACGLREAVLVVGHCGDRIRRRLGGERNGVRLHYLENPFYSLTGAAHSLWLARDLFRGRSAVIMEGDQLLHPRLVRNLMEHPEENVILADQSNTPSRPTEETLVIGERGRVEYLAWCSKGELYAWPGVERSQGEAVVMVRFGAAGATHLAAAVDTYLRTGEGRKFEIIAPLNEAIRQVGCAYVPTGDLPWIEIDFPEDMERAARDIYPAIARDLPGAARSGQESAA